LTDLHCLTQPPPHRLARCAPCVPRTRLLLRLPRPLHLLVPDQYYALLLYAFCRRLVLDENDVTSGRAIPGRDGFNAVLRAAPRAPCAAAFPADVSVHTRLLQRLAGSSSQRFLHTRWERAFEHGSGGRCCCSPALHVFRALLCSSTFSTSLGLRSGLFQRAWLGGCLLGHLYLPPPPCLLPAW